MSGAFDNKLVLSRCLSQIDVSMRRLALNDGYHFHFKLCLPRPYQAVPITCPLRAPSEHHEPPSLCKSDDEVGQAS